MTSDEEIHRLQEIIIALRDAWFRNHLQSFAHEREWETEEHEARRIEQNRINRSLYDKQTKQLLAGNGVVRIAPRCVNDLILK